MADRNGRRGPRSASLARTASSAIRESLARDCATPCGIVAVSVGPPAVPLHRVQRRARCTAAPTETVDYELIALLSDGIGQPVTPLRPLGRQPGFAPSVHSDRNLGVVQHLLDCMPGRTVDVDQRSSPTHCPSAAGGAHHDGSPRSVHTQHLPRATRKHDGVFSDRAKACSLTWAQSTPPTCSPVSSTTRALAASPNVAANSRSRLPPKEAFACFPTTTLSSTFSSHPPRTRCSMVASTSPTEAAKAGARRRASASSRRRITVRSKARATACSPRTRRAPRRGGRRSRSPRRTRAEPRG